MGVGVGADSALGLAVKSAPHFGQFVGHSGVIAGAGVGVGVGAFATVLLLDILALSLGSKVAILLVPREKFLRSRYRRFFRC